jgi:molybdopterin converting factor small subunit
MHINIKLMASLRSKLPASVPGGSAKLEVEQGSTIAKVLENLGISSGQVHLIMLNGEMERDRNRQLFEGDELTVFPPLAGGLL